MITTTYTLNGHAGRPMSAASFSILGMTKNPLLKGGEYDPFAVSCFLYAHFGDWKTVKQLAAGVKVTGDLLKWTEAVIEWESEALEGMGPMAAVEASELAARMMEDGFKNRVSVVTEGGEPGKSEAVSLTGV